MAVAAEKFGFVPNLARYMAESLATLQGYLALSSIPQAIMAAGLATLALVLLAGIVTSQGGLSRRKALFGTLVAVAAVAALTWIGPRPLPAAGLVLDWGSLVIAAAWAVVMLSWSGARTTDIMTGGLPFIGVMLLMLLLLAAFPQIATWLPQTVR